MAALLALLITAGTLLVFGAGILPGVLAACAIFLSLMWIGLRLRQSNLPTTGWPLRITIFALMLLSIIYILPTDADSLLSSSTRSAQNAEVAAVIETLSPGTDSLFSISRNRAGSMRQILLGTTLILAACISALLTLRQRKLLLSILLLAACVIAILGFVGQHIIPQDKTLWWFIPVEHGKPVACFVNRNHFGGFLALFVPVALMAGIHAFARQRYLDSLVCVAATCILTWSIIFSLSRGSWIAYGTGILLVLAYEFRSARLIMPVAVTGMIGCILAGIFFTSLNVDHSAAEQARERATTMKELSVTPSAESRLTTWHDSLKLLETYPVLGAGPDAFRMVFPQVRSNTYRKSFKHTENEYVQWLAEWGLLGSVLALSIAGQLLRRATDRRHEASHEHEEMRYCALAICGVAATHAMFDFAPHIPAYGIILAIAVGMLIPPPPEEDVETSPSRMPLLADCALTVLACCMVGLIASQGDKVYRYDNADAITRMDFQEVQEALQWAPTSWQLWHHLGIQGMQSKGLDIHFANHCTSRALNYDPNNYRLWLHAYQLRENAGDLKGLQEAYLNTIQLRPWLKRSLKPASELNK